MEAAVQVRVLQSGAELAPLREEWDEVLSESSADCLFLTWEWMTSWWRHLAGDRSLHVVEVRDRSRLIGLAPFTVAHGRLEFMGTGTVGSDYLDVIARRGSEREVIAAVAQHLEGTGINLRLSHIVTGSVVQRIGERLKARGYRVFDRTINVCPVMALRRHTWDTFLRPWAGGIVKM